MQKTLKLKVQPTDIRTDKRTQYLTIPTVKKLTIGLEIQAGRLEKFFENFNSNFQSVSSSVQPTVQM